MMDNPIPDKNANLDNITLALLFAADEPLSVRRIAAILEDVEAADIKRSIEGWRKRFDEDAWSISLEQVAGGYQLATRVDYAVFVGRLYSKRRKLRLSRAGMETLAIIAYKQPATRADIEAIRGVSCGGVIANLMERSLIKITGKAKVLGAPFLYGTTQEFLEYLGLNSLKDLPSMEELEALLEREAYSESAVEENAVVVDEGVDVDEDDQDDEDIEGAVQEALDAIDAIDEIAASRTAPQTPPPGEDPGHVKKAGAVRAARLGPMIEEPLNRPIEESPTPAAQDDEDPITQQTTIADSEDDR